MNRCVWVIVGLGAGCNGWPRFDHLPADEFVDVDGPVSLRPMADESEDGDLPDRPSELSASEARTGPLNEGLRWRGTLAWSAVGAGEETFDCPIEPIPLTYTSDIDFVRFSHLGGSLCVTVATALEGEARPSEGDIGGAETFDCPDDIERPLWEAPLYAIGVDGICLEGSWLNADDGSLPLAIGVRSDGLFFGNVGPGEYALFVAAVCGRYRGTEPCDQRVPGDPRPECVPYDLAIAVVPSQAACDALYDDLREAL